MKTDLVLWASSVLLAPLLIGLIHTFKARLQGRQGPSAIQPYFDLWKLLHKQSVWPETASLVFGLAPYLNFIVYALLIGLVLTSITASAVAPNTAPTSGTWLTAIFCLALARFVAGLAALDTGTPLAGLGGSRTLFFHVLTEPTLVALAYAFAWHVSVSTVGNAVSVIATLLIGISLLGVILLECGRLPFDNLETKLELTMIEKGVELDYSGPELAAWEWSGALRLTFFVFLFSLTVSRLGFAVDRWWLITQFVICPFLAILLAIWELTRPKTRLRQVINPATITFVLALSAILFNYIEAHLK